MTTRIIQKMIGMTKGKLYLRTSKSTSPMKLLEFASKYPDEASCIANGN